MLHVYGDSIFVLIHGIFILFTDEKRTEAVYIHYEMRNIGSLSFLQSLNYILQNSFSLMDFFQIGGC